MARSPWQLISEGKYEEAIDEFSAVLGKSPLAMNWGNRGLAYLAVQDYESAVSDFRRYVELDPRSDHGYIFLGVSQWCSNRPREAVETWRRGLDAAFTDAAGGVELPATLLYAAARLNDESLLNEFQQRLRKMLRRTSIRNWPGALAPYLLDKMTAQELELVAESGVVSPILLARHRCQVEFFVGTHALLQKDSDMFQQHMRACSTIDCQLLEHVFFIATWEVRQGFPALTS